MNSIYAALSKIRPFSKSYTSKFLFVAFLGIHIPLIGLICFLSFNSGQLGRLPVFLITLVLTLLATATTLVVLRKLLAPMNAAKNALGNYLSRGEMPDLPSGFKDEAGVLMRQVQETIQMLDALQDEQKDLIAFLSRDLRTPLSTIISLSNQLEQEPRMESALRKKLAGMIAESAQDQVARFKQMLGLLRNDAISRDFLHAEPISPAVLIDSVVRELKSQASRKAVSIVTECPQKPPFPCDAMLLAQVLKHVLSNAIRYSPQGAVVRLTLGEETGMYRFEIVDQGAGFNPSRASQLFERLEGPVQAEQGGSIGLYIARKIVLAHGGTIRAESPGINLGARFIVELPAA